VTLRDAIVAAKLDGIRDAASDKLVVRELALKRPPENYRTDGDLAVPASVE